jgi:hypothetical protein
MAFLQRHREFSMTEVHEGNANKKVYIVDIQLFGLLSTIHPQKLLFYVGI